jgi:glutathione S-transferase
MLGPAMTITLYVVHGSHPCAAVEKALELKELEFRRVELLPPLHAAIQRVRFGARTVPAMTIGRERVVGSRWILRRLEELRPQPALFPSDLELRAEVQRAEEWGDEVWQPIVRRLLWAALERAPDALPSYQEGSTLPALPAPAVRALAPVVTRIERRLNRAADAAVRSDLRALPAHLDRIDGWLDRGILGGPDVNAADLQIGATTRLALTLGDVRPFLENRPAAGHALELFGPMPGSTPAGALPAEWLGAARR